MEQPTTLGAYLRRERERRGLALRAISESTKVSVPFLEGLEADDISRWPGGIFRRAFVRSYAECVGLDPDDVYRRFEKQHQPEPQNAEPGGAVAQASLPHRGPMGLSAATAGIPVPQRRARILGTAADLTVAVILAFGSAAAGSRLLWPVLLIAGYYAVGVLLTGTSPMVALLSDQPEPAPEPAPERPPAADAPAAAAAATASRSTAEHRHQPPRTTERPRQRRGAHQVSAQ